MLVGRRLFANDGLLSLLGKVLPPDENLGTLYCTYFHTSAQNGMREICVRTRSYHLKRPESAILTLRKRCCLGVDILNKTDFDSLAS